MTVEKGAGRAAILARVLAGMALAGAALVPVMKAALWAWLAWVAATSPETLGTGVIGVEGLGLPPDQLASAAPRYFVLAGVITVVLSAPIVIALWSVRRTLIEGAAGRPFSDRSVAAFRVFAWASFWAVVADWLEKPLLTLAGSEWRALHIEIGVSSEQVAKLFTALLLVVIAHMFAEARRNAEVVEGLL